MREISLGVESGDDWTLDRIHKGYHAEDILEQCHKLEEAGIDYWMTFLNGVAGRSHSREHQGTSLRYTAVQQHNCPVRIAPVRLRPV